MTDERRKEIALEYVENQLIEKGIPGREQFEEILVKAGSLGIRRQEFQEFYESFVPKVLGKIFRYHEVSLSMKKPFDFD